MKVTLPAIKYEICTHISIMFNGSKPILQKYKINGNFMICNSKLKNSGFDNNVEATLAGVEQ